MRAGDVLRWGLYPGLLAATLAAARLAYHAGLPPGIILSVSTLGTLLLLAGLERLAPARPAWQASTRTMVLDTLHGSLSNGLANEIVRAAGLGALLSMLAAASAQVGIWPGHWPLVLQVGLGLLLGELCFYTLHRAAHETPWLWPWHAVHHSSAGLTVWSAPRNHPVNAVLSLLAQTAPAAALGAGPEAVLLLSVLIGTNGNLQHCNVDHRTGALGVLLATARQHRWHHSRQPGDGDSNYGSTLMLWDLLFGTWHQGPEAGPEAVGLSDTVLEERYLAHLLAPFRWSRLPRG